MDLLLFLAKSNFIIGYMIKKTFNIIELTYQVNINIDITKKVSFKIQNYFNNNLQFIIKKKLIIFFAYIQFYLIIKKFNK